MLLVNATGSLVLGGLVGLRLGGDLSSPALTVLGVGFCGALTTWSTFALDTATRLDGGRRREALTSVVASLALGLGAAAVGLAATGAL